MLRNGILLIALVMLGWGGSFYYRRYEVRQLQKNVHSQIAALRTYEEGYALRHGAYLVLPDSCKAPADLGWKQIGMAAPAKPKGCFRVEPLSVTFATEVTVAAAPVTASSIKIIGTSPDGKITGIESNEDKSPHWMAADGSPLSM